MTTIAPQPPLLLRREDGSSTPLPVGRWISEATSEEEEVLQLVTGPTLDIGCGPGRHVEALARRGVVVLGLDVAPAAVLLARRRGAAVLQRSVFERVPAAGRWSTALLLDGNIGIGGNAVTLLERAGHLLRRGGLVLVEVQPPGSPTRPLLARLETQVASSEWFPWMEVGVDGIGSIAALAGLVQVDVRRVGERWFVALEAL